MDSVVGWSCFSGSHNSVWMSRSCLLYLSPLSPIAEYTCPENKVYKPCGPSVVPTCNAR